MSLSSVKRRLAWYWTLQSEHQAVRPVGSILSSSRATAFQVPPDPSFHVQGTAANSRITIIIVVTRPHQRHHHHHSHHHHNSRTSIAPQQQWWSSLSSSLSSSASSSLS